MNIDFFFFAIEIPIESNWSRATFFSLFRTAAKYIIFYFFSLHDERMMSVKLNQHTQKKNNKMKNENEIPQSRGRRFRSARFI